MTCMLPLKPAPNSSTCMVEPRWICAPVLSAEPPPLSRLATPRTTALGEVPEGEDTLISTPPAAPFTVMTTGALGGVPGPEGGGGPLLLVVATAGELLVLPQPATSKVIARRKNKSRCTRVPGGTLERCDSGGGCCTRLQVRERTPRMRSTA